MSVYEITTDKGTYQVETAPPPNPTLGERFKTPSMVEAIGQLSPAAFVAKRFLGVEKPIESAGSAIIDAPAFYASHFANQFGLGYPELFDKSINSAANIFGRQTSDENIGGLISRRPVVGSIAALGGVMGGLKNPIFQAMKITPASRMLLKSGAGALTGATFAPSKLESPGQVAQEQLTKGAFGALLPPAFAVSGKVAGKIGDMVKRVGDEILNTTLGQRLAEHGKKVGFQNIPKYFTETVPREIVQKLTNFFPNATNVVGSKIDKIINSKKYADVAIDTWELQDTTRKMVSQIDDFDISTAEKNILKGLTDKLMLIGKPLEKMMTQKQIGSSLGSRWMSLPKLWELRKDVDKVIYQKTWNKPEAIDFLKQFRSVLNNPIRNAGDDVAKNFDRYSFIKSVEDELGGNFISLQDLSKNNIYSKKIAQFIEGQFSSKELPQREVIEILKDVERSLKPDDKVIDEMMNYAAANQLGEPIRGFPGVINKVLDYVLGGRRGVADKAAAIQKATKFIGEGKEKFIGGANRILTDYMETPLFKNPPSLQNEGGFAQFGGQEINKTKALGIAGLGTAALATQSEAGDKTLGQKNNNPINLKAFEKWEGQTGTDKQGHIIFKDLDYGIRGNLKNLKTHQRENPNETIADYMQSFAEENQEQEAKYIADNLHVSVDTKLKDIEMERLFIYLSWFETNTKINFEDIYRVKKRFKF